MQKKTTNHDKKIALRTRIKTGKSLAATKVAMQYSYDQPRAPRKKTRRIISNVG